MTYFKRTILMSAGALLAVACTAQTTSYAADNAPARARDLGVPFDGKTGPHNAITDVEGVEVGHATVIAGDNVRTGVSAIFPLGKEDPRGVRAAVSTINGTGEITGTHAIDELGIMFGPVMLTTTWSVGTVRDGYLNWVKDNMPENLWVLFSLPVVAETSDEGLNDTYGMHVTQAHATKALSSAASGPVTEGNVGGGTGMQAYGFKGGIGTASRIIALEDKDYTVGVLVQANHGEKKNLRIAGLPVGKMLVDDVKGRGSNVKNSLIVVIATDLPFRADQLERLARRGALGLGRTGAIGTNVSGDFVLAFTTSGAISFEDRQSNTHVSFTAFEDMDIIFQATVEAVEEALVNQLVASDAMTANGITLERLPHDEVKAIFANAK